MHHDPSRFGWIGLLAGHTVRLCQQHEMVTPLALDSALRLCGAGQAHPLAFRRPRVSFPQLTPCRGGRMDPVSTNPGRERIDLSRDERKIIVTNTVESSEPTALWVCGLPSTARRACWLLTTDAESTERRRSACRARRSSMSSSD